jgi:glycyl-tRNA synthetase beta subunit
LAEWDHYPEHLQSFWNIACKVKKLYDLSCHPVGESFFSAYKRLDSLLSDLETEDSFWDPEKLCHEKEDSLKNLLLQTLPESWPDLLNSLKEWTASLNGFFDEVKVSDAHYQSFRLALLRNIRQHFSLLGSLSFLT